MLDLFKRLFCNSSRQAPDLGWISQWGAASEEVGPDGTADDFSATITLSAGVTYDAVVSYILDAARGNPVLDAVNDRLTKEFGLAPRDAVTAIDRCMGGIFRAMAARPELCPNLKQDPIAWHSFQMATANRAIIDDIESVIKSYRV